MDGKELYELLETVRVTIEFDGVHNAEMSVPQYVELVRELISMPLSEHGDRRAAVKRWLREQDNSAPG